MRKAVAQENKRRKTSTKKIKVKSKIKEKKKIDIKLNKKQISTLVIVLLAIVLIVVINNYTAFGLVLNKNINSDDVTTIELKTSNNKIYPYLNEVLVYNKGVITSYNSYGKATGEIVLEDTIEADIQTSGKYIQVINKDKGLVYVYKNKYETARIKIEGQIYSGSINEKGISVIEYSSSGNKTELGVYDNSGNKKYNIKLSNSVIGKYVLSDNSRYLAYVDVNVKGISAQTNINVIDLSNVKNNETVAKTVYTAENDLAYDIYWDGKNIVTRFAENYLIYNISSDEKNIIRISDGQISNVGDYNNRFAYTQIATNGSYILNLRKMKSDSIISVELNDTPKYFVYEEGMAYVCYGKNIEVYNNFGMKIKNFEGDMVITEPVVFNNGRSVVMAISNKLIMFTI